MDQVFDFMTRAGPEGGLYTINLYPLEQKRIYNLIIICVTFRNFTKKKKKNPFDLNLVPKILRNRIRINNAII